jgi:hypothetical protein
MAEDGIKPSNTEPQSPRLEAVIGDEVRVETEFAGDLHPWDGSRA